MKKTGEKKKHNQYRYTYIYVVYRKKTQSVYSKRANSKACSGYTFWLPCIKIFCGFLTAKVERDTYTYDSPINQKL